MNKTSKFKLILYMIFSNLFLFIALTSDYTLEIMKNNTWYSPIFVFLGYIFLILIIPTNNKHLIKKVYSSKLFHIVLKAYLLIQSIILIYLGTIFYSSYVNFDISIILFILISILLSNVLSNKGLVNLINLSSIFFMICLILYIIPIVSNTDRYTNYLLPISFDLEYLFLIFILIFIPVDNIIYLIFHNYTYKPLTKKDLIIFGGLFFLLLTYIYTDLFTLLSYKIYDDYNLSFFFHWQIYNDNKYVSNYDIALLFIMLISFIFKLAGNSFLFKLFSKKKKMFKTYLLLFIAPLILYYIDLSIIESTKIILYALSFMGLLLFTIYTIIIRRKSNETIN